MRNLVIDIGNTRVKYGVFIEGNQVAEFVDSTLDKQDIFRLATNHQLENIIYSSVASSVASSLDAETIAALKAFYHVFELSADLLLPITNAYATPATLGKDRLAAVVGAHVLYPGKHCLVVDAGTCMTLDVLRADAVYLGGNISPGVHMRLRAMHTFTARLPMVELTDWSQNWGNSTTTALQNGALLGAALEIEALNARLQKDFPELILVLTGGDAEMLANRIEHKIFVHSNLVLQGLNKILTYNVEKLA